jgi:cytochrome c biogenesis protein CcmG, thiol:disulfide interchange protein DsbE
MFHFGNMLMRLALSIAALLLLAAAKPAREGDIAPPFELTMIDGSKVRLDDLRGQVIILNFWATWCGPCKKELPLLDGYYAVQKSHGLRAFAIATEDSLPPSMLKALFAAMRMPSARRIKGPYPVLRGVPTNYIIDRSGRVVYAKAAALDLDDMNRIIVPLLQAPVPVPAPAQPVN